MRATGKGSARFGEGVGRRCFEGSDGARVTFEPLVLVAPFPVLQPLLARLLTQPVELLRGGCKDGVRTM